MLIRVHNYVAGIWNLLHSSPFRRDWLSQSQTLAFSFPAKGEFCQILIPCYPEIEHRDEQDAIHTYARLHIKRVLSNEATLLDHLISPHLLPSLLSNIQNVVYHSSRSSWHQ